MTRSLIILLLLTLNLQAIAQPTDLPAENWHLQDHATAGYYGVSAEKAFKGPLASKSPTNVVVAIIDSGTESFHPDLIANIWVNEDEVPGNQIDDDKNGYIDDIHGWSFIGGEDGDVSHDNLEFTRVYKSYLEKFQGRKATEITESEQKDWKRFLEMDTEYKERLSKTYEEKQQFEQVISIYHLALETFRAEFGKEDITVDDLQSFDSSNEYTKGLKEFLILALQEDLASQIDEGREHLENSIQYSYNLDFDPRHVVGDNYNDPLERLYGNNHIDGPEAEHGTHVAGIVGAKHNNFGVNGVCDNARLMIIRCVPDGDERDKDVANAIRYAADNGARIINMSFGKSLSPFKNAVDDAVKYAESKGVLLIHASGNDGRNMDIRKNYPNDEYETGGQCQTWIEVAASGPTSAEIAADFSNYGRKKVDLFAPGVDIYSTMTSNTYKREDGTSMAAPVVTGVAAVLLAYYPELSAIELKKVLMDGVVKPKKVKAIIPGQTKKKASLKKLCVSGGIVNLYNSVLLAEKLKK